MELHETSEMSFSAQSCRSTVKQKPRLKLIDFLSVISVGMILAAMLSPALSAGPRKPLDDESSWIMHSLAGALGTYNLIVNNGSGSGDYTDGQFVPIVADAGPGGQVFAKWTGDTETVYDIYASETMLEMMRYDGTITATYTSSYHQLAVGQGSGDGEYGVGAVIQIAADPPPAGQVFHRWTGDTANLADIYSAGTSVTMPSSAVSIAATYSSTFHTLTITSGSGDGEYAPDAVVRIRADADPYNLVFSHWTGDTGTVANVNAANTTLTMTSGDVQVQAVYILASFLTVGDGNGSGWYEKGASVQISAFSSPGATFVNWTGGYAIYAADINAPETIVDMPPNSGDYVYVYANYTLSAQYHLLYVYNGSRSGIYQEGETVQLEAEAPTSDDERFVGWWADPASGVVFANPNSSRTTIAMPDKDAALYPGTNSAYLLTVNSGFGDGRYFEGAIVYLVADPPPGGQVFDKWVGDTSGIEDVHSAITSRRMDYSAATVTATYAPTGSFYVTVVSGSGSGWYGDGAIIPIVADTAPASREFDRWTGDTAAVANVNSASTTITMPTANVTVTATYRNILYALTVNSGSGDGQYAMNAVVPIVADAAPAGQIFDRWTGDTSAVANVNSSSTTVTMPASTATVTATYKNILYALTVNSGSGDGSYDLGTVVPITANAASTGREFDRWIGDTSAVANVNSASTTVTMPAANITVTATYKNILYTLTVTSGSGDGEYAMSTVVPIAADTAPAGKMFDEWTGDTTAVADLNASATTVTMPAGSVAVTATYRDIPASYVLTVVNGSGSGTYDEADVVLIVADTAPLNQVFDRWTGDTETVADIHDATTNITIPAADVTVTATYRQPLYTLTVNSGSGDGQYPAGAIADLLADPAPAGKVFERWAGDTATVAQVNDAGTTATMPASDITITAVYRDILYTLTVNSGSGSGSYPAGTVVNISADPPPAGMGFDQWIGGYGHIANAHWAETTVTMGEEDTIVTAGYVGVDSHTLTVNSGAGSGTYLVSTEVIITADTSPVNKVFDQWTGDTATVENIYVPRTQFTMPASNAILTATYKDPPAGAEGAFREDGGIVCIEAEHFTGDEPGTGLAAGKSWTEIAYSGASGSVMQALPNTALPAVDTPEGCRLDFKIYFQNTGAYYMYTRIPQLAGGDNSIHNGLDGVVRNANVYHTAAEWRWPATSSVSPLSLEVTSVGVHTVNIWMREDGVVVDKLYLRRNYVGYIPGPNEIGPSESPTLPGGDTWYALTVVSGSGTGSYGAGETIPITADTAPLGKIFDRWTGDTASLADPLSPTTQVTMPAADVTVTATYKDVYYNLLVYFGSGSGQYLFNTVVPIAAEAPQTGMVFDRWTGDTSAVANVNSPDTTVTMPALEVVVTATYKALPDLHTLTVNSGTGSGAYDEGEVVSVSANPAPFGQIFDRWTGDTAAVANVNSADTSVTMPAAEVTISAVYKDAVIQIGFPSVEGLVLEHGGKSVITWSAPALGPKTLLRVELTDGAGGSWLLSEKVPCGKGILKWTPGNWTIKTGQPVYPDGASYCIRISTLDGLFEATGRPFAIGTVTSLEILGPDEVDENSTAQYTCMAHFNYGEPQDYTAKKIKWSTTGKAAKVKLGLLTAGGVAADTPCTLAVGYGKSAGYCSGSRSITIRNR